MEAVRDRRGACLSLVCAAGNLQRVLIVLQGTVAVTFIAVNAFFNRETREGLSAAEQSLLHQSFQYTGGGLVLTALAARSLFKSGFAFRLMAANPCA